MTNEQREAIDYLKESILIYKNTIPKISNAIDTVLSLIKENQEKIEKYEKIYREYDCYRWVKELDKKDKQIDLMAEYMIKQDIEEDICMKNRINADLCNENYTNCKDCIKQYFERKATNNG